MAALRVPSTCLRQSAAPSRSIHQSLSVYGLATRQSSKNLFESLDTFTDWHVGPDDNETSMLGFDSMESFLAATVPQNIRIAELHASAKRLGRKNEQFKGFIDMGYHNAVVPPVILRNVFENPAWYIPYTRYQLEIALGRLESLVNFQRMIMSLTSMHISNASLLDEATAAAEAMVMAYVQSNQKKEKKTFFVDKAAVLPQTISESVLKTRAKGFGINLFVGDMADALKFDALRADLAGVLIQYPDMNGLITDYSDADLLALTLFKPPGPRGAFSAVAEKLKRKMPGRLIGRSKDTMGNPAYRLALQTTTSVLTTRMLAWKKIAIGVAVLISVVWFFGPRSRLFCCSLPPVSSTSTFTLASNSTTSLGLVGWLIPQTSSDGLATVFEIFSNYIHGTDSQVTVYGAAAGPSDVTWLNEAIQTLQATAYDPMTGSNLTTAAFTLPFAFPVDITALAQNITTGYDGRSFAELVTPWGPSTTDVQNRFIYLAFSNVPFAVYPDQHETLQDFVAATTLGTSQTLALSGTANADASTAVGVLSLVDMEFFGQSMIVGLQGLKAKPAFVANLDVDHGYSNYLLITVDTSLFNPSNLTIGTGDVSFALLFEATWSSNLGTFPILLVFVFTVLTCAHRIRQTCIAILKELRKQQQDKRCSRPQLWRLR
ncbi:glycine cleavage system P-protein-domain-containing protein [Suillus occidentalis]|nr:glycine cleavage system P-protein-domain-containing protein [Suillus occidentalis]